MSRTFLSAAGLLVFLLVWEAIPRLGFADPLLLPPPSGLPEALWREVASGYWSAAVLSSLNHYLVGLLVGTGLGVGLGVATALAPRLEATLAWVIRLLRPVPGLAWVPFAVIWFGISEAGASFIVAVGVIWINYYAAFTAARAVDRDLLELATAFGQGGFWPRLTKIVLPGALCGIMAGVRTGLGQAWMAVIAAELFGVPGLGSRMTQASSVLATDVVLVYMVTIACLFGLTDALFMLVRDRLLGWQR